MWLIKSIKNLFSKDKDMSEEDTKTLKRGRGKAVGASGKPNDEVVSTENRTKHERRGKAVDSSGKPNK